MSKARPESTLEALAQEEAQTQALLQSLSERKKALASEDYFGHKAEIERLNTEIVSKESLLRDMELAKQAIVEKQRTEDARRRLQQHGRRVDAIKKLFELEHKYATEFKYGLKGLSTIFHRWWPIRERLWAELKTFGVEPDIHISRSALIYALAGAIPVLRGELAYPTPDLFEKERRWLSYSELGADAMFAHVSEDPEVLERLYPEWAEGMIALTEEDLRTNGDGQAEANAKQSGRKERAKNAPSEKQGQNALPIQDTASGVIPRDKHKKMRGTS